MKKILIRVNFLAKRLKSNISSLIYNTNIAIYGESYLTNLAKRRFQKKMKRSFDWDNPQTLNEIVTKSKVSAATALWSDLADKYRVREYIQSKGLEDTLVDLYGVWDCAKDIDFSKLPDSFVIKSTNGCAKVMIVKDKSALDIEMTRERLQSWLYNRFGYNSVEPHYLRIKPRIIIEQLLVPAKSDTHQSNSLIDYKWYCFNGNVTYVFVASNRGVAHNYEMSMYDKEWVNHSHFVNTERKKIGLIPRPTKLNEMIKICEILSKDIPFVRVDLYEVNGQIYFGEMTFTPVAGNALIQTAEFDSLMGEIYYKYNPQLKC